MQNKEENPADLEILASWVLKKLARDDYNFEPAGHEGRWELTFFQWEEDFEEPLKPEFVELLASQVLNAEWLARSGEASGAMTDEVLRVLFGPPFLGRHLKDMRVRLGPQEQADAESYPHGAHLKVIREVLASAVLVALGEQLPKMINRIEQLRSLPTNSIVTEGVQTYLEEASKCFICGQFISCLIVCQSAIEFALCDRLKRQDTIDNLIRYGPEKLHWALNRTLDDADQVRRAANDAIHPVAGDVPTAEICKDMFVKTRGVLRELYSEQGPLGPLGRASTG